MIRFDQECFEAYTNSDLTEGRGHKVSIGFFTHQSDAVQAAKKRGVWGSDASVEKATVKIRIYESFDEYKNATDENIREKALSKLTDDEKRVLGL
jgi:hypothetical protein